MDKQDRIKQLRKRLVVLLAGLALSYAVSFGAAIFLAIDADLWASDVGRPLVIGFGVLTLPLAFVHVRAQFRRYDYLVRMAEGLEDE